ncbi:PAS domain S-box protein [Haloarcula regularis]
MRILDLEFNVVVENDAMTELGGVDAEESEAIKCYDQFCNPEVCGTGNCTLKQIVDGGTDEIRAEVEKESYDGRVIPTELVVKPIRNEAGDVVAISETFHDISDRKRATGSIKRAVDELKASSEDVAQNSQDISDQATAQLEAVTEVSEEVASLSATVEEIAATADEVQSISTRARAEAEEGATEAEETIEIMSEIEAAADEVTSDIRELNESIQQIDEWST